MTIKKKSMFISSYVHPFCISKGQLCKTLFGNSNSLILARIRVDKKHPINRIKNLKVNRRKRRLKVKNLK